jgi:FHA domain
VSSICREGHVSDEADYCSVCGAAILSAPASSAGGTPIPVPRAALISAVASREPGSATCPSCSEPREDPDGRFCEVCRYDFFEKRPGPPPVARAAVVVPAQPAVTLTAAPAPVPLPVPLPASAPVSVPSPARSWELVIAVDASLDTEPDADNPCPVDRPAIVMPVDVPDMLIGRHDETRAIHPEISLHDPGASRRHAKFVLDPDGGIALQDLASTNGTQVNGQDVPAGTRRRLRDGDRVTLGRWTRITVRGKA